MNTEEKNKPPAWAEDMNRCRALAQRLLDDVAGKMETAAVEVTEGASEGRFESMFGQRESVAQALISVGTFMMRWHTFERGLEDMQSNGLATDADLKPADLSIMEQFLTRPRTAAK